MRASDRPAEIKEAVLKWSTLRAIRERRVAHKRRAEEPVNNGVLHLYFSWLNDKWPIAGSLEVIVRGQTEVDQVLLGQFRLAALALGVES